MSKTILQAKHGLSHLAEPVLESIMNLAGKWKKKDVRLILFGSFANGTAASNSDLDIAFEMKERNVSAVSLLRDDVEALPTIRPVDLVDVRTVDASLLDEIQSNGLVLPELTPYKKMSLSKRKLPSAGSIPMK